MSCYEQKRWDEAASLGASWARAEVANPGAWLSLGTALSMLSRNHEAQAALERTVELSPDDPRGLYQLGVVLARSGQGGQAAADDHRMCTALLSGPHPADDVVLEYLTSQHGWPESRTGWRSAAAPLQQRHCMRLRRLPC